MVFGIFASIILGRTSQCCCLGRNVQENKIERLGCWKKSHFTVIMVLWIATVATCAVNINDFYVRGHLAKQNLSLSVSYEWRQLRCPAIRELRGSTRRRFLAKEGTQVWKTSSTQEFRVGKLLEMMFSLLFGLNTFVAYRLQ